MSDKKKYFRDILITIAIGAVFYLVLQFSIGTYIVYETCMLPGILPDDRIIVNKLDYFFHKPERGDVIVLKSPGGDSPDLLKRIIAIPGDTIEIRNDKVLVNDRAISEPYIKEAPHYKYGKEKLSENSYFVLGDNRNAARDSHIFGPVSTDTIIGKTWVIYWPFGRMQAIQNYKIL
jgi:signal peptidase I